MRRVAVVGGVLLAVAVGIMIEEQSGLMGEGDRAPEFTATVSTGETIRLSEYAGKKNVVLFFYPKDFSAGCTEQVCSYRDNYSEIRSLDAVMFGVSYDADASHRRFAEAHQLPFPLISDPDRSLSRLYGAARFGGRFPLVRRVTYVIDKTGIIRKVSHHEFVMTKHTGDVLEVLRELKNAERLGSTGGAF